MSYHGSQASKEMAIEPTELPEPQIEAAKRLLKGTKKLPEDNIRQNISRLLDSIGIDNILTYPTREGPADVYLPRRRVFIETKSVGGADGPSKKQARGNDESPLEQLERYLRAETARELDMREEYVSEEERSRPWVGILTDGITWHAWRYPHEAGAVGKKIFSPFRPNDEVHLISRLRKLLSEDPLGKPWIPENSKTIFEGYLPKLRKIRQDMKGAKLRATETKYLLWRDMLRTSSMEPDNEYKAQSLFTAHSFLVAIARGVIHTLANPNEPPDPKTTLKEGFVAWIPDTTAGKKWASQLLEEIHGYDWRRRKGDVLRPIYEEFIDDTDRKVFGEYYTPDWLADLLVREVLDDDWCERSAGEALTSTGDALAGIGVLDPACGSGTFLYHAIQRLLNSWTLSDPALPAPRKAEAAARLVRGMDIHPVAVEIARATVLRALPAIPPDGDMAVRVYQGDALMAHRKTEDSLYIHSETSLRFQTPKERIIIDIPKVFAYSRNFATNLRSMVQSARDGKPLRSDILRSVPEEDREALKSCHEKFGQVIRAEGNSVWAWYVLNITGPLRLSEQKIDRIVSNPPWVIMKDIQAEKRKNVLEEFFKEIELWDGGVQAGKNDIAQLFVKRCRELYMADTESNPAAWIVKRTAMSGDHWACFRIWHSGNVLKQVLDLGQVKPFGGGDARKACVLMDHRPCSRSIRVRGRHLVASYRDPKNKLQQNMTWEEASARLKFRPAPKKAPYEPSEYMKKGANAPFRQGATLTPKVLLVLDRVDEIPNKKVVRVVTARSTKDPWKNIDPQKGEIPERWAKKLYSSKDLFPFATARNSTRGILPIGKDGRLEENPGELNEFWAKMDALYSEHRSSGKDTPKTLLSRLDYRKELSGQLPLPKKRTMSTVLYPASADIMRAARADTATAIVDNKMYRWAANTEDEAAYLVAVLNASALTRTFADCRSSGRDFHLYPWRRVPIPLYDSENSCHKKLAALAKKAEKAVKSWLEHPENSKIPNQKKTSGDIRDFLAENGIFPDIDKEVKKILPNHAA